MTPLRRLLIAAALSSFVLPACVSARSFERGPRARASFAQLTTLIGTWERVSKSGRRQTVTYRLVANGTALVEQFTPGDGDPAHESMTIYSLDGDRLIATHYCMQGNQPRLVLTGGSSGSPLAFEMIDGTNLHERGKSHQQSFTVEMRGEDEIVRVERYVDNEADPSRGEPDPAVVYRRVPPQSAR